MSIIQLCRQQVWMGQQVRTWGKWNKDLTVPITVEDEVSFTKKYSLIATINHSGTLNRGHCWAFIKDLHSSTWYFAMTSQFLMLKIIMSIMLHHTSFFTAKFKFFPRIFQIFSWFCKAVLSFQTRSLGVTTPHITPILYENWVCSLNFQAL